MKLPKMYKTGTTIAGIVFKVIIYFFSLLEFELFVLMDVDWAVLLHFKSGLLEYGSLTLVAGNFPRFNQWKINLTLLISGEANNQKPTLSCVHVTVQNVAKIIFPAQYLKFYLSVWDISHSNHCSTSGVTKAVVCVILSVGWCI